jgi:hypothetical protein
MPKPPLKPHVQKHLEKRDVDHAELPDDVIVVLNEFSESELRAMSRLGETMEVTKVEHSTRVAMVH